MIRGPGQQCRGPLIDSLEYANGDKVYTTAEQRKCEMMKNIHCRDGQTLIETAFALLLLLIITLGGIEFARLLYVRNSLKNAVRQGARVAAVTPTVTTTVCPGSPCPAGRTFTPCPGSGIVNQVCTSPGVPTNAQVNVCFTNKPADPVATLDVGDTINVCGRTAFPFVVGGSPWPWPGSTVVATDASMRYE